jgi:flagellar hook-basal body complex protein FliE
MAVPFQAASAYSAVQGLTTGGAGQAAKAAAGATGGAAGAGAFGDLLTQAMQGVANTGARADVQTVAAAQGQGDLVDVVTAVAESEAAIETLVAVRDRIIAAYEEIMRMPV